MTARDALNGFMVRRREIHDRIARQHVWDDEQGGARV